MSSYVPVFGVGNYVKIKPLCDRPGRVIETVHYDNGWIYVVRYLIDGDVRMMRCLEDELKPVEE